LEHPDRTGKDLYQGGFLDGVGLQRFQVWERTCGIIRMEEEKCLACPHVRRVEIKPPAVPVLVTMDGKNRTPIIDQTFAASLPGVRSNRSLDQPTVGSGAWLKKAQEKS
jgi:hypothetical protein